MTSPYIQFHAEKIGLLKSAEPTWPWMENVCYEPAPIPNPSSISTFGKRVGGVLFILALVGIALWRMGTWNWS